MISLLTAVLPDHTSFLPAVQESLARQRVDWEWLIQIDGPDCALPVRQDERIRIVGNGRHLGASFTRNRALLRASGDWVMALDADDELLPGGLDRLLDAVREHAGVGYAVGRVLDLFPDGQRLFRFAEQPYRDGPLEPGRLEAVWRSRKNLFLQPGVTLYRRDVVLAAGGWPAITGMEDQDLLLTVSTVERGVYVSEPVYLYRQHPMQSVRTGAFEQDREMHRRWCDARLRAMRSVRGEDGAALAALQTPIPDAGEIERFTTPQWRAAVLAQFPAR